MTLNEIREKRQNDTDNLFSKLGVFWAFSNQQFIENKTPLQQDEKYIDIGGGGFIPKHNVSAMLDGMKEIGETFKKEVKEHKQREANILYELNNHECFYTGDIENAIEPLGEDYNKEEIQAVYKKYKAQKYAIKN